MSYTSHWFSCRQLQVHIILSGWNSPGRAIQHLGLSFSRTSMLLFSQPTSATFGHSCASSLISKHFKPPTLKPPGPFLSTPQFHCNPLYPLPSLFIVPPHLCPSSLSVWLELEVSFNKDFSACIPASDPVSPLLAYHTQQNDIFLFPFKTNSLPVLRLYPWDKGMSGEKTQVCFRFVNTWMPALSLISSEALMLVAIQLHFPPADHSLSHFLRWCSLSPNL